MPRVPLLPLLVCLVACKPAAPEDKYRRALSWTKVEDVREHLAKGMGVDHTFADGMQPIHVVAESMHGNGEIMRLLLERGANVDAKTSDGKTAWDLRWSDGKRELSEDDASVLLALLDHGFVPPKSRTETGKTLLHLAAERCPSARMIAVLVEKHGFDVNARDKNGWTPLHFAASENNTQAATGLLQKGADPNAETTHPIGHSTQRHGRSTWRWRYEAGSRPLDLFSYAEKSRFDEDVRKILEQYGATNNEAVHNKPR